MEKRVYSVCLTVLLIGTLCLLNSCTKESTTQDYTTQDYTTQDYTQWHLPYGVKSRLGKGSMKEIKYSPDGTKLAVSSSIGIWIYDAHTGDELDLLSVHSPEFSGFAYSPDGITVVGKGDDTAIRLWDAKTGIHLRTLTGGTGFANSVFFSPDGSKIAITSAVFQNETNIEEVLGITTIRLWDANTGKHLHTLTGDRKWIIYVNVSFSPDRVIQF